MESVDYNQWHEELQLYLKSTNDDEQNIINLLKRGHAYVQGMCGKFELDHTQGRNLVFNWVRFEYNGHSEHFDSSFADELSRLSFELWEPEGDLDVKET